MAPRLQDQVFKPILFSAPSLWHLPSASRPYLSECRLHIVLPSQSSVVINWHYYMLSRETVFLCKKTSAEAHKIDAISRFVKTEGQSRLLTRSVEDDVSHNEHQDLQAFQIRSECLSAYVHGERGRSASQLSCGLSKRKDSLSGGLGDTITRYRYRSLFTQSSLDPFRSQTSCERKLTQQRVY